LDRRLPCRKAATYTGQHKHNKCRQAPVPRVGFEPTIPVFQRAKTFRAIDRAATLTGPSQIKRRSQNYASLWSRTSSLTCRYTFPCYPSVNRPDRLSLRDVSIYPLRVGFSNPFSYIIRLKLASVYIRLWFLKFPILLHELFCCLFVISSAYTTVCFMTRSLLLVGCLPGLLIDSADRGSIFLRIIR
jgi:hypothetical protein